MSFVDLNDLVVSQVRQAADIVDIIGQVTPLRQAGRSYKGLCPFHREKTPSFTVDRSKGLFYCFGCGTGGDVFKFLMLAERYTFPEAVEHVASRVGIQLPRKSKGPRQKEKDDFLSILDDASAAFHQALEWKPNAADDYLRNRMPDTSLWARYGFGYAPDSWDYLLKRLGGRYSTEQLESVGLVLPRKTGNGHYDRFRNRLMIPIHSESGTVIAFGGRSLDGSDPKYLNSPESEVFNKSQTLYNLHRAKEQIRRLDRAILVEGYFDCIALDSAGIGGVVASMGTSLTPGQASLLSRFSRRVVICYDGDHAGKAATLRGAPILLAAGLAIEVLNVGSGDDPDTYLKKYGIEGFMEQLGNAKDVFTFALEELAPNPSQLGAREKSDRLDQMVPLLTATTGVARNEAAQKIADGLRLEFDVVWSKARGGRSQAPSQPHERTINEPVSTGEKRLLRAALQESIPDELVSRLREEYFEDAACRSIYSLIRNQIGQREALDFSVIATHLRGDEELRRLSELSLADDADAVSTAMLEGIVRQMERNYLTRRSKEIQIQTQEAERGGDSARLDELLLEKRELSRLLHTLK